MSPLSAFSFLWSGIAEVDVKVARNQPMELFQSFEVRWLLSRDDHK